MLRVVLLFILIIFVARAFWRVVDGLIEGISGRSPNVPAGGGVQMVRDPVCGTFVLPSRAVTITDGRKRVCFCSITCRDAYRSRTA
jgi:hypothetical protein